MTTLSWWLCCPMHLMVKTLGMLGWAEQRSSTHLLPNPCISLFVSIMGTEPCPVGQAKPL